MYGCMFYQDIYTFPRLYVYASLQARILYHQFKKTLELKKILGVYSYISLTCTLLPNYKRVL